MGKKRRAHNRLDLDVEYIAEEYMKGRSAQDIAKEKGVSKGTILRRLREQGVERRQRPAYDEVTKEVIETLYNDKKMSTRAIAEVFGCSNRLVLNRLRKYGIPTRKHAGDPAFTAEERKEKWGRSLERHNLWKGGVTSVNNALRGVTNEWSLRHMREYDFKCFVLGEETHNLEVHHIKPFSEIRDESIAEMGLEGRKTISEYTVEELEKLKNIIIEKHENIKGYPLDAKIHQLFHSEYGFDTDLDDLLEFKERYLSGEFNESEAIA